MALPLLAGGLTVAFVALVAWWWRTAPTRARCPRCDEETAVVLRSGPAAVGEAMVQRRWCTACGWSGLGRAGPEWTPGRPSAHDSGFHWGEGRFPRDFGFHFAARPEAEDGTEAPPVPPDHPSGFRFSRDDGAGPAGWDFRWADASGAGGEQPRRGADLDPATDADPRGPGTPPTAADEGPGFRWGTPGRPREGVYGFRWKDQEG